MPVRAKKGKIKRRQQDSDRGRIAPLPGAMMGMNFVFLHPHIEK